MRAPAFPSKALPPFLLKGLAQGEPIPNRQVLDFLHELRGRTMPAYHTRPAGEGGTGAKGD
jgi:hypothetical protein